MKKWVDIDADTLIRKSSTRLYAILMILFFSCLALTFIPEFSVIFLPIIIFFSLFFHALCILLIINLHRLYKATSSLGKLSIFNWHLGVFIMLLLFFLVACYFFHSIAYFCLAPEIGAFWGVIFVYTVLGITFT